MLTTRRSRIHRGDEQHEETTDDSHNTMDFYDGMRGEARCVYVCAAVTYRPFDCVFSLAVLFFFFLLPGMANWIFKTLCSLGFVRKLMVMVQLKLNGKMSKTRQPKVVDSLKIQYHFRVMVMARSAVFICYYLPHRNIDFRP